MNKEKILELIYDKYIEPTVRKRDGYIGIEIEMPIVNLNGKAVDFDIVHQLTSAFLREYPFRANGIDENNHIYSAVNDENGDVFSYDCSYNNLELSFGKEKNLHVIYRRFSDYYKFIQGFLETYNYTLTGMGINPFRRLNHNVPIENGRYKMLYHHLSSFGKYKELPMYFHQYPQFGMFSSASQVQLDIQREKLPLAIDTFNKLEPIKALLFNNSVLLGENEHLLCCRDMLWENSTHGINPHNIGMYDCDIREWEDILHYISTTSIYCTERDGKYLHFSPVPMIDYFNLDSVTGEYVEDGQTKVMTFSPEQDDIQYLRTFKFEDLTFRGTIEFRSACCQPISDVMTVGAFHTGLMECVEELHDILQSDTVIYHNGYSAVELRKQMVQAVLPSYINKNDLYRLTRQILDLCYKGLQKRNFGEEIFLSPLYSRAEQMSNPAKSMLDRIGHHECIENIIRSYS